MRSDTWRPDWGDEYDDGSGPAGEEPNTTQQTNRALIKWSAWIPSGVPIPTVPQGSYPGVIGLFEGAHYHPTNWYRPKLDCLMRDLYVPFCEVCSEGNGAGALPGGASGGRVHAGEHERVGDERAGAVVQCQLAGAGSERVERAVVYEQHGGGGGRRMWGSRCSRMTLGVGTTGLVSAVVRDGTLLVRNDPTNLLTQTIKWNVGVNIVELTLDSPEWLGGGKFAFRVRGYAPQGFAVQAWTNFAKWVSLRTNTLTGGGNRGIRTRVWAGWTGGFTGQ